MDELDVLARDFGFRPAGKSAPMRSDGDRRSSSVRYDDPDGMLFNDVFGGPPKYTNTTTCTSNNIKSDFNYDSIFKSGIHSNNNEENNNVKMSSLPVYDKPVYDEDIFDGLPGVKSKSVSSSTVRFEDDVFATMTSTNKDNDHSTSSSSSHFDDLLGNLGRNNDNVAAEPKTSGSSLRDFDDLLAGFGTGSPATSTRSFTESTQPSKSAGNSHKSSSVLDDPFVVLESTSVPANSSPREFSDPLEEIGNLGKSGSAKTDASSVSGGVFDDLDPLNGFSKSVPPFSPEKNTGPKDEIPSNSGLGRSDAHNSTSRENIGASSFRSSESHSQKKVPEDSFQESPLFDMPSGDTPRSFGEAAPPPYADNDLHGTNYQVDASPRSEEQVQPSDDIWLSVSEIPLFTQPTSAPPPARPPPPIPRRSSKSEASYSASNARRMGDGYSSSPNHNQYSQSPKPFRPAAKSPPVSQLDELDDFARGWSRNNFDENTDSLSGEQMSANSVAAASAAAMKDAMDRAEAKFKHAKEVREREHAKAAKSKEAVHLERDEEATNEVHEREFRENLDRLENERRQREKEEEERAQKLARERERAREIERDRGRQAVERATREARERAAVGARDRAAAEARLKSERAAVEKAAAEARERAERAAVQRAQAEARERAAAEAKDRAERAAAEAREKASAAKAEAEARRRAERAAVERAAAEARERAAAEARERAAAAAKMNQQRNDNDLESFFSMGRASSAPKTRTSTPGNPFDSQFQTKPGSEGPKSTSGVASNMRKASSTTSFVDDLSSIFGASASAGEFQEVEGETEERRRARLERHQRTQERAAKALAEKNQRDLNVLREQEERHRISETLDFEIKRWAAGKEGNLRALLSTLQYVLWPECGWQPVSLTDLITGASVKKVYRKATLCIHPDKVQQKGANLQQKYIAEKVFDLLKEAWNKFNSEELF